MYTAFLMNACYWGHRNSKLSQSGQKNPKENNAPPRPGASPNPAQGHDAPPDLDELWRRFNHRLTALFRLRKNKGDLGPPSSRPRIRLRVAISIILSFLLMAWLGSGLYIVGSSRTGVVLQFGAYRYTTLPGVQWHWPFPFQSHEFVDTATHTVEIGAHQLSGTRRSMDSLILTQDGGLVDARFVLNYRVTDAHAFLFNYADAHTRVVQAGEAAVREVFSTLTIEDTLNSNRIDIPSRLTRKVQEILDLNRAGILVASVAMRNAQLPKPVKSAFEEAVKVVQERERQKSRAIADAQQTKGQARIEAKQMVDQAERYKARAITTARGESARFKQVLAGYVQAPEITRERMYLETMQAIYMNSAKVLASGKAAQQFVLSLEKLRAQDQPPQKASHAQEVNTPFTESMQKKEASPTKNASQHSREIFRSRERSRTSVEE